MGWFTIAEAAADLKRAEKTVRNRLYRHELPRKIIRGPGRVPREIIVISGPTLERLRGLMWHRLKRRPKRPRTMPT